MVCPSDPRFRRAVPAGLGKRWACATPLLLAWLACSSNHHAGSAPQDASERSDVSDARATVVADGAIASVPGPDGNDSQTARDLRGSETAGTDAATTQDSAPEATSTDATTAPIADAVPPTACPASAAGDQPLGSETPPAAARWKVTDSITFTSVGGTGSYDRVVDMAPGSWPPPCTDANACVKASTSVSGPLVPFDEEMTMVFSGPMELYAIAVYVPATSGFSRVSYWDRCTSDNLVFMNNLGGGSVSGVWTVCGGNSQSYASSDGTHAAPAPTQFAGVLADGVGVNVMSGSPCSGTGDASECGFYRDVGLHGWKGSSSGTMIFAVKLRMPVGSVTPAYWILPAQVVRTAQYGCNCRGMGGAGGCGELDVAEVLSSDDAMAATSTIYSFKSVRNGNGSTFQRPVLVTAVFVVIFDAEADSLSLRRLDVGALDFGTTLDKTQVAAWQAKPGVSSSM